MKLYPSKNTIHFYQKFLIENPSKLIHKKLVTIFILWSLQNFYQILLVRTFYTFLSEAFDWKSIKFNPQQTSFISIF